MTTSHQLAEALKIAGWLEVEACGGSDWNAKMNRAAELLRELAAFCAQKERKPAGEAGSMPGTSGFTLACFKASEVPIGTKLYTSPQSERDAADAKRFSWFIENSCTGSIGFGEWCIRADDPATEWRSAIDAAMASEKEQKHG